ncbi:unnamed protein product [Amoebophrya sp. A25]|nr:unnamed protein product [Amoebophrya sp. A25]|eukprot:GSA25T00021970001.1
MQAKQRQKQARKEVDSRRAAKARPPFPPPPKTEAEIEQEELNQWLEEIDTNEASKAALKMQNKQRQKLAKKEVNKRKEAMQKRVAEKAKADQERAEARAKEQAELDEWMKGLGDDANAAALKMQSKQRQREARRQVSRKREEENRVNFGDVDFILEDAEGDVGTTRARLSSDSYPHPSKAHPIFKAEDFHVAPDGSRRNLRARKESEPDLRNFAIMHADLKRDQSQDLRVAQEFERLQYADARRGKGQLLGSGPYVKRQLPEHKDTGGASNQAAEGEALLPFFQKPLGNTRGVAATSVMMIDSSTAATVPMSEFDDDGMEPTFRRSPKLAKVEEEPPSSSSMHQKQNGGLTLSSGDGSMRSIMLATGPIGMSAQDYINNDDEARLNNRIVVPGAVPSAPAPADAESLFVRTPGPSGIFLIDQVGAKQSRFALAGVGKDVKDRPALPQYVSRRSTHRGEPRSSPFKQTGKQAMSSPTSSSYRKHGNKGTGKHAADSPQRTTTGGAPGGSSSSSRSSVTIGAPSPSSGAAPVILDAPPSSSSTGAEDSGAVELQKRMEAVSRIPRLSTPFEVNTKSILGDPVVKKIMLEQEKKLKIQEEVFRRLNFVARKDDDDKLVLAERLKYYGVPGAPSRLMADGSWMPDPDEGLGLTTRRWPMDFAYSSKQQREAEMTQKWIDEEMRRTGKSEEQVQAEILEAASDRDKKRSPKNRGSSLSPRGVTKVIKAYGGGVMGEREMKRGLNPEPPRILEASPEHVEISPLVFGQSTDLNTKERVTPGSPRNHVAQVTREQKRKAARMKAIREIQAYTLEPAAASSLPVEDSRKRNQSMAARGEAVMSSMEPPRGGGRPIEGPLGWNLSSRALKIETGAPTQHQGIGSASNASSSPAHSQATHGKASSGSASREQWYDRHHIIPAKDNFEKQSLYRDYFSRPQETMDNIRTGHTSADYYDTLLQQERNNWKYKK